jgi:hypothetical protein
MNPSHTYTQSSMSSHDATVDHPIIKHCPILSVGDITPKALIDLEDAHNEYFIAKEINKTDKVKKILRGFKYMHIRNWIALERERYSSPSNTATLRVNYGPTTFHLIGKKWSMAKSSACECRKLTNSEIGARTYKP